MGVKAYYIGRIKHLCLFKVNLLTLWQRVVQDRLIRKNTLAERLTTFLSSVPHILLDYVNCLYCDTDCAGKAVQTFNCNQCVSIHCRGLGSCTNMSQTLFHSSTIKLFKQLSSYTQFQQEMDYSVWAGIGWNKS